jgi:hypothetical protein
MNEDWLTDNARKALWFCAKLRYKLSLLDTGKGEYEDRIYLFQSSDQDAAEIRAAEIGHTHELNYLNLEGGRVEWRFLKVLAAATTFLDTPLSTTML